MRAIAEEFVKVWQGAESATAVGKALGTDPRSATSRAVWLRKKGVPLKKMAHRYNGRRSLDIKTLTKLAKESLKEK